MTPREFIKTIYYGDRACKALLIDTWQSIVKLQVNSLSRIRSITGEWDYYSDEDIDDGYIVFTGVDSIELLNAGHMPNDLINSIDVVDELPQTSIVEISITSVSPGVRAETRMRIRCTSIHLEDPAKPGVPIVQ